MKLLCKLFGHIGNEFESGFHVCSKCGLHEYHCHEEYIQSGYLLIPFYYIKDLWFNFYNRLKWKYIIWKDRKNNNDVPF